MKPKIIVFGMPERTKGKFYVFLHSGGSGNVLGEEVFSAENNETGRVSGYPSREIDIGAQTTITIMSFGAVEHSHTITYLGGDISYVPLFRKETNTTDDMVANDWDMSAWRAWNPRETHKEGVEAENKALVSKEIVKVPLWDSYYYDSRIDYAEKFHKLWIGLNAYASSWSSETGDRLKILSLVNSPLRDAFNDVVRSVEDAAGADRYREFQKKTGLNMSSDIVRDEIGRSCSVFEFLHNAKLFSTGYATDTKELDGFGFLSTRGSDGVFMNVFGKYHKYMASEEGIVGPFNLADAFEAPFAPISVKRTGRLLFHDPFESNSDGWVFDIADYFGSDYACTPYCGQTTRNGDPHQDKQQYEKVAPFFSGI